MPWCRTCEEYMLYPNSHVCPPTFLCRMDDRGYSDDDATQVCARDAERAAEKYCEQWDSGGDYDVIRSGSANVKVTDPRTGEATFWEIVAESVPQYTAYSRAASALEARQGTDAERGRIGEADDIATRSEAQGDAQPTDISGQSQ